MRKPRKLQGQLPNMDWRKIEQVLADAAGQQGFKVRKDGSGRFVVVVNRWSEEILNLEDLAREVAERVKP